MRVLITGSRDWDDANIIRKALIKLVTHTASEPITLISGACPTGADRMCEVIFQDIWGGTIERHPADWEKYGKRAGFVRNAEMVNLGADFCLAFIKNNSKGATMTKELAEKAGIRVKVFRSE